MFVRDRVGVGFFAIFEIEVSGGLLVFLFTLRQRLCDKAKKKVFKLISSPFLTSIHGLFKKGESLGPSVV